MTIDISTLGSDIPLNHDSDTGTSSFIVSVKDDSIYKNEESFVVLMGDSPECGILLQIQDNDGNVILVKSDP